MMLTEQTAVPGSALPARSPSSAAVGALAVPRVWACSISALVHHAEPVAVGDLDHLHASSVEAFDDLDHVFCVVLMADGVRAVAQSRVDETVVGGGHALTPRCSAMASPTRMAAAVMMSRLPA